MSSKTVLSSQTAIETDHALTMVHRPRMTDTQRRWLGRRENTRDLF